jgi:hypothetical protein
MESLTGLDIPYPAPFGLTLGLALLLWQWKGPVPAGLQATGR